MHESKSITIPLAINFKLCKERCPVDYSGYMEKVPYTNVVGFVIYCSKHQTKCSSWIKYLKQVYGKSCPKHQTASKWLLRYLRRSSQLGLCFRACSKGVVLKVFIDANFVGDAYMFTFVWYSCQLKIPIPEYCGFIYC